LLGQRKVLVFGGTTSNVILPPLIPSLALSHPSPPLVSEGPRVTLPENFVKSALIAVGLGEFYRYCRPIEYICIF
jgi:hypothetical protein